MQKVTCTVCAASWFVGVGRIILHPSLNMSCVVSGATSVFTDMHGVHLQSCCEVALLSPYPM